MIPALQALSDAILAVHQQYGDNPESWDDLLVEDDGLLAMFADFMDDSYYMLRTLARIVSRAEGDRVTMAILEQVKLEE